MIKGERELRLIRRSAYGKELYYPDCPESRLFARIARTKTLTGSLRELLEAAGYSFKIRIESANGAELNPKAPTTQTKGRI